MVSKVPEYLSGEKSIKGQGRLHEYLGALKKEIDRDMISRADWVKTREDNWKRRYGLVGRGTEFPWPGAADIVIPMEDMTIDRVKPQLLSLITGVTPTVRFFPMNPKSVEMASAAEWFFEWLLKTNVPDFIWQMTIACDDLLQGGFSVLKVIWEYETRLESSLIELKRLPGRLAGFHVLQKATPEQAAQIAMLTGGRVRPMTKDQFDANKEEILKVVQSEFRLSDDDEDDKKAANEIMRFLRAGEMQTVVTYRVATKDHPRVYAVDPLNLIVPNWTGQLEDCGRITHRVFLTEEQLMQKGNSAGWDKQAIDMILARKNRSNSKDTDQLIDFEAEKNYREGLFDYGYEELIQVYETYCYYDFEGDGNLRRAVIVWHPDTEMPLKAIPLPYDHGKWPFVYIPFELNDNRYYSPRGIPEKIKDLSEEITQQHRAKLNRMTIANSPTFKFKRNSGFNPGRIRWIPGDFYGVSRMDDFDSIQIPNLDISFEREENILRNTIESYVGTTDFAVTNPLQPTSTSRTAAEINLIQNTSQTAIGYRGTLFQQGMRKVYNMIWDLWLQYGSDEVFVRVASEEPIKMTKIELQGDYDIVPAGTIGTSNPSVEEQKALQRLLVLAQNAPLIANDIRYEVDLAQGFLDYLNKGDRLSTQRVIRKRSPEEIQQIQAQQQQQQALAQGISNNQPVPLDGLMSQLKEAERKAPFGGNQEISF